MIIYAIYRMYYGEDFIEASIKSIYNHVEKIFVFAPNAAYGNVFIGRVDKSLEIVQDIYDPDKKIIVIKNEEYTFIPKNQFTDLYNTYIYKTYPEPGAVMTIEHDMIWEKKYLSAFIQEFNKRNCLCMNSGLIEFWHNNEWMIPFRNRNNCILDRLKGGMMYKTRFSGDIHGSMDQSDYPVYNYGLCMKPVNMKMKCDLGIKFANIIQDSIPYENWFEEVWYRWDPDCNNMNLEISINYRHYIPYAYRADVRTLEVLKDHEWNPGVFI